MEVEKWNFTAGWDLRPEKRALAREERWPTMCG
jgi:hypothetical protein